MYTFCVERKLYEHGAVLMKPPEPRAFRYLDVMERVGHFTPIVQVR